jgi:hypothetical protein
VASVNINYHIEVDKHYYSVSFRLLREKLDVRLTSLRSDSPSRFAPESPAGFVRVGGDFSGIRTRAQFRAHQLQHQTIY